MFEALFHLCWPTPLPTCWPCMFEALFHLCWGLCPWDPFLWATPRRRTHEFDVKNLAQIRMRNVGKIFAPSANLVGHHCPRGRANPPLLEWGPSLSSWVCALGGGAADPPPGRVGGTKKTTRPQPRGWFHLSLYSVEHYGCAPSAPTPPEPLPFWILSDALRAFMSYPGGKRSSRGDVRAKLQVYPA